MSNQETGLSRIECIALFANFELLRKSRAKRGSAETEHIDGNFHCLKNNNKNKSTKIIVFLLAMAVRGQCRRLVLTISGLVALLMISSMVITEVNFQQPLRFVTVPRFLDNWSKYIYS
jgi:hypothetical protein